MELRHIKYFLTVAEEGSITKAAQKLMIAQPPLSRQIKELEHELGVSLFARGKGKSSALTPEGMKFLAYARRIINLVIEAENCFSGNAEKTNEIPADTAELMNKAKELYAVLSAFVKEDKND